MSAAPAIDVIGTPIHCTSVRAATEQVCSWGEHGESRYVCLANTHMLMEAHDDHAFGDVLMNADLNCPDGMPLVWMQRALGVSAPERVRGADLMWSICAEAARRKLPIGLYGGREDVLATLERELARSFPDLEIAYRHSPPFRAISAEEDQSTIDAVHASGARVLFVGLGCPKQERWMARHRGRLQAVMLGVGAAFDMHAGVLEQAPVWMQKLGLEWAHRLSRDPRRLGGRYLRTNPRFVALALKALIAKRSAT